MAQQKYTIQAAAKATNTILTAKTLDRCIVVGLSFLIRHELRMVADEADKANKSRPQIITARITTRPSYVASDGR